MEVFIAGKGYLVSGMEIHREIFHSREQILIHAAPETGYPGIGNC
jgi:hypothetical protein